MTNHYFPAANTSQGFFSYFDNILTGHKNTKIVYIKGGSGCGKSTLMKKLAKKAQTHTELFHCSSDPSSLDAVAFPEKHSCIVDATAPHILEPVLAGISGKILDLGVYLDEKKLTPYKETANEIRLKKQDFFSKAYCYFSSAGALFPANEQPNLQKVYEISNKICKTFAENGRLGKCRRLFASGLTPDGNINYLPQILNGKIIGLTGGTETKILLEEINLNANLMGYDTDMFYCPLFPTSKPEHLVIPSLSLSFTTINSYHSFSNVDDIISFKPINELDSNLIREIIDKGLEALKMARAKHEELEKIYISAMDFSDYDMILNNLCEYLIN